MQAIVTKVKNKIFTHGRGWVFTSRHFSSLGPNTAIRAALSRLQKEKVIHRLVQGVYYFPQTHEALGILSPDVNNIAKAFAEKNGAKIQPSGAYAANLIGLSEQVPGRVVFLTDGPTGKIKIKNLEIEFRKTTVKNMHAAGSREALVIQALKFIGQKNVTSLMLETMRKFLKPSTHRDLEKNLKLAPYWIRTLLFDLLEERR